MENLINTRFKPLPPVNSNSYNVPHLSWIVWIPEETKAIDKIFKVIEKYKIHRIPKIDLE